MASAEILPALNDGELAALHANALRLQSAEGRHRQAAMDLVPLIEAELAARAAARPVKPAPVRRKRATAAKE